MPRYKPKHMKKMSGRKRALIIAVLLIAATLMTTVTYAWLQQDKEGRHTLITGSVTVTPVVTFAKEGVPEGVSGDSFKYNGYYVVDLTNPAADNFYSKLRIKILFKGVTKSYIRVYLADMGAYEENGSGTPTNYIYLKENTKFSVDSSVWVDNRDYDNYYYYIDDIGYGEGIMRSETASYEVELDFVTGLNGISEMHDGKLYLDIGAEAVQFNRIEAFWGIDDLSEISGN